MKIKQIAKIIICHISPKTLSKYLYYKSRGRKINLKKPELFDEKLMWLKLENYHNNPQVWKCCDKYYMREYALKVGVSESNLVKLIGVYNNANEINFDELPNKFVLKCSHGCGFNIICMDKMKIDENEIRNKLDKWKKMKYGYETAELQYNHVEPKIICEQFIDGISKLPYDYKLYCFNGKVKCVLVCSNRENKLKLNFYDLNWKELPLGKKEFRNCTEIKKPYTLEEMISIAEKVSKEFPFVRVDFYEYNKRAILGELTFTPGTCAANYYNSFGEQYLGELLDIEVNKND